MDTLSKIDVSKEYASKDITGFDDLESLSQKF
jgi:hypothetical protein